MFTSSKTLGMAILNGFIIAGLLFGSASPASAREKFEPTVEGPTIGDTLKKADALVKELDGFVDFIDAVNKEKNDENLTFLADLFHFAANAFDAVALTKYPKEALQEATDLLDSLIEELNISDPALDVFIGLFSWMAPKDFMEKDNDGGTVNFSKPYIHRLNPIINDIMSLDTNEGSDVYNWLREMICLYRQSHNFRAGEKFKLDNSDDANHAYGPKWFLHILHFLYLSSGDEDGEVKGESALVEDCGCNDSKLIQRARILFPGLIN